MEFTNGSVPLVNLRIQIVTPLNMVAHPSVSHQHSVCVMTELCIAAEQLITMGELEPVCDWRLISALLSTMEEYSMCQPACVWTNCTPACSHTFTYHHHIWHFPGTQNSLNI